MVNRISFFSGTYLARGYLVLFFGFIEPKNIWIRRIEDKVQCKASVQKSIAKGCDDDDDDIDNDDDDDLNPHASREIKDEIIKRVFIGSNA